jgi:hypothetical protein
MFRFVLALALSLYALPSWAMDFHLVADADGQRMVLASGPIKPGDAQRLARALNKATVDSHGTRDVLLNSPGGVVYDAVQMASVMKQVGVTTIIPADGVCASACASVLFVAGKYRVIQGSGSLAIHSCFDARDGRKMDDCDAAIALLARENGVSAGAMMAFQEMAPGPGSVVLLNAKDAACFGLTRAPGKAALGDNAPCIQRAPG